MKETEAARAVLIEVLNALGAMRDEIVIVGGWVPELSTRVLCRWRKRDLDRARKCHHHANGLYEARSTIPQ
jgi:hypothetical protein